MAEIIHREGDTPWTDKRASSLSDQELLDELTNAAFENDIEVCYFLEQEVLRRLGSMSEINT